MDFKKLPLAELLIKIFTKTLSSRVDSKDSYISLEIFMVVFGLMMWALKLKAALQIVKV